MTRSEIPTVRIPDTDRRHDTVGLLLGGATVTTGLVAGVYYAYACSVMIGLGDSDDRTFVEAMQQINEAIQNPVFFAGFFGALLLPGIAAFLERRRGLRTSRWTWAGLALYTTGFLITVGINVPLNNRLAAAGIPSQIVDLAAVRSHFENTWNAWNIVRAVLSTAAVGCLGRALVLHGRRRLSPTAR